ncbi:hypothetical protein ANN_14905 [Periplaneta americana]|uniref:Uncharacterized protein n=1 Tax=Periplaneta americana TaxID=6978 RepID=A0ABQ8SYT4_PERAM|nr:hypothetical protein ANN_14905 [Periplaneta americana]
MMNNKMFYEEPTESIYHSCFGKFSQGPLSVRGETPPPSRSASGAIAEAIQRRLTTLHEGRSREPAASGGRLSSKHVKLKSGTVVTDDCKSTTWYPHIYSFPEENQDNYLYRLLKSIAIEQVRIRDIGAASIVTDLPCQQNHTQHSEFSSSKSQLFSVDIEFKDIYASNFGTRKKFILQAMLDEGIDCYEDHSKSNAFQKGLLNLKYIEARYFVELLHELSRISRLNIPAEHEFFDSRLDDKGFSTE